MYFCVFLCIFPISLVNKGNLFVCLSLSASAQAPRKDLPLSRGLVAAVVRSAAIWVPGGDDELKAGDIAIVLVQADSVDTVLALFTPGNGG